MWRHTVKPHQTVFKNKTGEINLQLSDKAFESLFSRDVKYSVIHHPGRYTALVGFLYDTFSSLTFIYPEHKCSFTAVPHLTVIYSYTHSQQFNHSLLLPANETLRWTCRVCTLTTVNEGGWRFGSLV